MANKDFENTDLNDRVSGDNQFLSIDIVHKFSQEIIVARAEKDIFNILVNDVASQMGFIDCVIYKVDKDNKVLKQVAAFGDSKLNKGRIKNPLELTFGQGHAGKSAEEGKSFLIPDVTKSPDYLFDVVQAGSEIVIPVKIHKSVYAVISSEHPEKKFYKGLHQKLWEVIASIAAGALVKIHEKEELEKIKIKLEGVLEKKSADLDKAIETLSAQYSEMKYHHDKQETLTQEVHHRVTNNLQIVSSILRLYINREATNTSESLREIYNRIQVMALIYQNIYKSMEMNLVNTNSYLSDLLGYLKSTSKNVKINSHFQAEIEQFSLDVLVPLGLYITEVFYFWIERAEKQNLKEIGFNIQLNRSKEEYLFEIIIKDKSKVPLKGEVDLYSIEGVNYILLSALIDQLEGELTQGFENGNFVKLQFKALNKNK